MSLPGTEIRVEPDRQDVLARGSVGSHRRGKRHLLVTAALIASLAAVAGQALAADGRLNNISPGTRLSAKEVQSLTKPGPAGQSTPLPQRVITGIRRLGQMNGYVIYALEFKNLEAHFIWGPAGRRYTCYNASRLGAGKITGGASCRLPNAPQFPSPEVPVVDMSLAGADRAHPTMHTIQLTAVVANGITRVGVLGSDGNVYGMTRVSGNVAVSGILPWQADGPTIAYGADGAVIWCRGGRTAAILYAAAGCPQTPPPSPPTP